MDPTVQANLVTGIFTLAGVVLGVLFQSRISKKMIKANERDRMISLYDQWIKESEETFEHFARTDHEVDKSRPRVEHQIRLFEKNKKILRLLDQVYQSFENIGLKDKNELSLYSNGTPNWSYPPFSESISKLVEEIKKKY